jgi:hypothetical protein
MFDSRVRLELIGKKKPKLAQNGLFANGNSDAPENRPDARLSSFVLQGYNFPRRDGAGLRAAGACECTGRANFG